MSTDSVVKLMEQAAEVIDQVGDGAIVDFLLADLETHNYDRLNENLKMYYRIKDEYDQMSV